MKKKIIIITVIVLAAGSGILWYTGATNYYTQMGKQASKMEQAQNEKTGSEKAVIKGEHFTVGEDELTVQETVMKLMGVDNPQEEAKKSIAVRESLYVVASEAGYRATKQEVTELVAEIRKNYENSDNKEEIQKYIKAFGSEGDFWKYQEELESKDLVIKKYLDDQKENLLGKTQESDFTQEEQDAWGKKYEELKEEAVAQENVQYEK